MNRYVIVVIVVAAESELRTGRGSRSCGSSAGRWAATPQRATSYNIWRRNPDTQEVENLFLPVP